MLAKIVLVVVVLMASQYYLFSRLSSGSLVSPEMPRAVVIALNWAFVALVLLAVFQLLTDLVTLIAMLVHRHGLAIPEGIRYATAVAPLLLSAIGVSQAIRVPTLKDVTIEVAGLPTQFDGYRLLQLTDLHISRLFPRAWTEAVVEASNRLGVDLIVVTGDMIDGSVEARKADVEPLAALHAPDGVYAIPGNHEYFFDSQRWMNHFSDLGLRRLENSHVLLERDGAHMVLAGVTDLEAPTVGLPGPDLTKALAGAPQDVPIILLDHQPRKARLAAKRRVAVQLSGHTHGGMVVGLDRLLAVANEGYVSGSYQVGDMHLYVSNGAAL